jgi:hypothetical protein
MDTKIHYQYTISNIVIELKINDIFPKKTLNGIPMNQENESQVTR